MGKESCLYLQPGISSERSWQISNDDLGRDGTGPETPAEFYEGVNKYREAQVKRRGLGGGGKEEDRSSILLKTAG